MKKIIAIIFAFIMSFTALTLDASSGKLKSASICTGSDGITYGNHGDGHWHVAVKHDAGWYPQGANLGYDNPCNKQEEIIEQPVIEEIIPEPEIINSKPELQLPTDTIEKYHFELSDKLDIKDLVNLFEVKANDLEDGDITANITANVSSIKINNKDETHAIIFEITDSQNETTTQEVFLKIKSRKEPSIQLTQDLVFSKAPSCQDILDNPNFSITDADKNEIPLQCENITINTKNKTVFVEVNDSYNLTASKTFAFKLEEKKHNMNILSVLLVIYILIVIMYFAIKIYTKNIIDITDFISVFNFLGISKFIQKKYFIGLLYLFTLGFVFILPSIDLIRLSYSLYTEYRNNNFAKK